MCDRAKTPGTQFSSLFLVSCFFWGSLFPCHVTSRGGRRTRVVMFLLLHHCPTISPPGDFSRGIPFCCLFFSFVVCLYFFLLVVFSVFDLQCDHSKPSVPWGFLEEFAYFHLLDVVVLCLLLLFPSFDVVVCLPIVPCSAKYFLFFMLSVSCCFSLWSWCLHISRCCWWCLFFRFLFFCVFQVGSRQGGRRGRICTLFLVFFGRSCFAMFFLCFFHLFFCFFFWFLFLFLSCFSSFLVPGGAKNGVLFQYFLFLQDFGPWLGAFFGAFFVDIVFLEDFHCWHVHSR